MVHTAGVCKVYISQTRKLQQCVAPDRSLLLTSELLRSKLANGHVSASRESFRAETNHPQPSAQGEQTAELLCLYRFSRHENITPLHAVINDKAHVAPHMRPVRQLPFRNAAKMNV